MKYLKRKSFLTNSIKANSLNNFYNNFLLPSVENVFSPINPQTSPTNFYNSELEGGRIRWGFVFLISLNNFKNSVNFLETYQFLSPFLISITYSVKKFFSRSFDSPSSLTRVYPMMISILSKDGLLSLKLRSESNFSYSERQLEICFKKIGLDINYLHFEH